MSDSESEIVKDSINEAVLAIKPAVELSHKENENHFSHRSPWLRALVLGANDGLVSTAALMMGVGGGSSDKNTLILAGLSSLIGGALSMACGEFISVYSQRDTEIADLAKEKYELEHAADRELEELTLIYMGRGLSRNLAEQVAKELTENDALRAHARDELGIDLDELSNPGQASFASGLAFVFGALIPLLAGAFWNSSIDRLISILVFVSLGLGLFGGLGAYLGGAPVPQASVRVLIGGWVAMGITFGIGKAFGDNFA
jgi:VIT1/CCC1 family predicted Fe2+/Mn2+ transporter